MYMLQNSHLLVIILVSELLQPSIVMTYYMVVNCVYTTLYSTDINCAMEQIVVA
jgi:hypothetical protein